MRTSEHLLSGYRGATPLREVYKFGRYPDRTNKRSRKNGRLNLDGLKKKAGVYAIYEQRKGIGSPATLCYIGMSKTCLYATISRHFQNWKTTRNNYHARIHYTSEIAKGDRFFFECVITEPEEAHDLEVQLIKKYRPPHNGAKYDNISEVEAFDEWLSSTNRPNYSLEDSDFYNQLPDD